MDGVVVVDKPEGITSHDVVNRARRLFQLKRIGHTGTLDPLATGVLVLCLGQATRIVEYLSAESKGYRAQVVFGVTTDTEDVTGHIVEERDASAVTRERVCELLPGFRGSVTQVPPMVSAVHHQGRRLYDLAREGVAVERTPRPVQIHRLDLLEFVPGGRATAAFEIECSTGTYIRTLAADLGAALGVGGMMETLRRTRVGAFTLDAAHTLEALAARAEEGTLARVVRPIAEALAYWPLAALTDEELDRIRHGQPVCRPAGVPAIGDTVLIVDSRGVAVAIARPSGDRLQPVKVLVAPGDPS